MLRSLEWHVQKCWAITFLLLLSFYCLISCNCATPLRDYVSLVSSSSRYRLLKRPQKTYTSRINSMATVYRLKKARIIGLICSLLTTLFILWIWSSMDTSPIFSSDRRMKLDHLLVPRGDNLLSATISQRAIRSYDESIQKDRDLMCAMEQPRDADPAFVEQSSWTSLADLPKYGWNVRVNPGIQGIFGLEAAFSDLGISSSEAEWRTINLGHNTQTTEGSTIYPATFAQFLTL